MPRVKRGVQKRKRRKKIINAAKGFKWRRKSTYKSAKQAMIKAWSYQYRDRRRKKREMRRGWENEINKAVRECGLSYSKFMSALRQANIVINRKILSELSTKYPGILKEIVNKINEN